MVTDSRTVKIIVQAYECGLVTEVIDEANFEAEAMAQVKELSNLAIRSMEVSKALVQGRDSRMITDWSTDQVTSYIFYGTVRESWLKVRLKENY